MSHVTIRNYTPHSIVIVDPVSGEVTRRFESEGVARVEETQRHVCTFDGVEVRCVIHGDITGLPADEKTDVYYIVSMVVAQANARLLCPRVDLLCPDTGKSCKRDERGQIVGVTGFVIY